MFEESEIINLVLGMVSFVIVVYEIRKREIPGFRLFFAGFACVVLARLFTVVEGIFLGGLLNTLEHLCYVLSGVLFAAGCKLLMKRQVS